MISGNDIDKAGGGKRWQTTVQRQLGGLLIRSTSSDLPILKIPHVGKMIDPTENFPEREYFTFSEKLEWARRLERIERVKAEERMKAGKHLDPVVNCPHGKTRDIVAEKSGFGSSSTYRRAKFIAENAIAKLDAGTGTISVPSPIPTTENKASETSGKNYRTMVQI